MKKEREVTFSNIKYGMLVEVHPEKPNGSYHTGMKVHFFNQKGVLVGNIYQFLPYERLRFREPYENGRSREYPRTYYRERFESIKNWFFRLKCNLITKLIRSSQLSMAKI